MANNKIRYTRHENNIESLISAPLRAVSKANMLMLSGQTKFVLNNCFDVSEEGLYRPKMVNMTIQRGNSEELTFQVPLLSLLPLNSLAVEQVKLNFSLDITSTSNYEFRQGEEDAMTRKSALNGRFVKNSKDSQRHSTHMDINIDAKSIPIPNGMKTLIDLYSKVILPTNDNEK